MGAGAAAPSTPAEQPFWRARVFWGYALLVALGIAAPWLVYPVFAMNVLCLALFASAFNLLLGHAGLLSFGHAAFLGGAAYVAGVVTRDLGLPPELGLLAGVAFSTALGAVEGALAIRRSGITFAMITLGFAQLVHFLAVQLPWTGGEDGFQGIPRGRFLGLVDLQGSHAMYFFTYGVFLLGFGLLHRVLQSPFGRVLRAIRENEPRALSLGYDVDRHKLLAFVLSAGLAGLAGALRALVNQFAALPDLSWQTSGAVILMTLLGGLGTELGPSVGALLVTTLEHGLAGFGSWVRVITGAVFVACVLAFRRGIVGEIRAVARRSFHGG
jgi:branched-chain amino acid transport system permease protein